MRIRDDEEDVAKITRICSKCKEAGHNARTCARRNNPNQSSKRKSKKARRDEMLGIDTQDEMTQPTQPTQPSQASTSTSRGGGRGTQPTQPSQASTSTSKGGGRGGSKSAGRGRGQNVVGRSGVNGGQNGGDDNGGVRLRSGMRLRGGRGRTDGRFNWWLGGERM
ncbi:hypothetical protein FRX31_034644 [Thalictrum thalictroides]|uniref:Uncharacterized protein n=1 Tax=Thalictrum thalictroides TaxID=46969 RepID=A0A7J6UT83_THATH|nr:hypothetical protein FRX31_034644 [Thalictrum thalictroides]